MRQKYAIALHHNVLTAMLSACVHRRNELLGKPVWQVTGKELLFLAQHGNTSVSGDTAKESSTTKKNGDMCTDSRR